VIGCEALACLDAMALVTELHFSAFQLTEQSFSRLLQLQNLRSLSGFFFVTGPEGFDMEHMKQRFPSASRLKLRHLDVSFCEFSLLCDVSVLKSLHLPLMWLWEAEATSCVCSQLQSCCNVEKLTLYVRHHIQHVLKSLIDTVEAMQQQQHQVDFSLKLNAICVNDDEHFRDIVPSNVRANVTCLYLDSGFTPCHEDLQPLLSVSPNLNVLKHLTSDKLRPTKILQSISGLEQTFSCLSIRASQMNSTYCTSNGQLVKFNATTEITRLVPDIELFNK